MMVCLSVCLSQEGRRAREVSQRSWKGKARRISEECRCSGNPAGVEWCPSGRPAQARRLLALLKPMQGEPDFIFRGEPMSSGLKARLKCKARAWDSGCAEFRSRRWASYFAL